MDEIKPESAEALKQFEAMNIEPIMLTGDNEKAAHYVAHQVGIKKSLEGCFRKTSPIKSKNY